MKVPMPCQNFLKWRRSGSTFRKECQVSGAAAIGGAEAWADARSDACHRCCELALRREAPDRKRLDPLAACTQRIDVPVQAFPLSLVPLQTLRQPALGRPDVYIVALFERPLAETAHTQAPTTGKMHDQQIEATVSLECDEICPRNREPPRRSSEHDASVLVQRGIELIREVLQAFPISREGPGEGKIVVQIGQETLGLTLHEEENAGPEAAAGGGAGQLSQVSAGSFTARVGEKSQISLRERDRFDLQEIGTLGSLQQKIETRVTQRELGLHDVGAHQFRHELLFQEPAGQEIHAPRIEEDHAGSVSRPAFRPRRPDGLPADPGVPPWCQKDLRTRKEDLSQPARIRHVCPSDPSPAADL